jgi:hypothetical protein
MADCLPQLYRPDDNFFNLPRIKEGAVPFRHNTGSDRFVFPVALWDLFTRLEAILGTVSHGEVLVSKP